VFFPSITLCNLNLVEASFFKTHNISEVGTSRQNIVNEFIIGHAKNLDEDSEHEQMVKYIQNLTTGGYFLESSTQNCKDMIISIKYQEQKITFREFYHNKTNYIGSWPWATDFGLCCMIIPHAIAYEVDWSTFLEKKVEPTKHGKSNGLEILLDAEQFNYAFQRENGIGFNVALHHSGDKPMFQLSSESLNVGTNTQLNVKPTITNTTEYTINHLKLPEDRQCYADGEQTLEYLSERDGYRYEINNCLIDQAVHEVIWNCRCYPLFGGSGIFHRVFKSFISYCSGQKLFCENQIMKLLTLGGTSINQKKSDLQESSENPLLIGNFSRPPLIKCLPRCLVQDMITDRSHTDYPQQHLFIYTKVVY
jgi:hypothetical protein